MVPKTNALSIRPQGQLRDATHAACKAKIPNFEAALGFAVFIDVCKFLVLIERLAWIAARYAKMIWQVDRAIKSGHPESNQGPSDYCKNLQSDALPTEL